MTPSEETLYLSVQREIETLKAELQATKLLSLNDESQPASLPGQYVGKPIPFRLGVEIPVAARGAFGDQNVFSGFLPLQEYTGVINIDSMNDFVATSFYMFFKFDTGAVSGLFGGDVAGFWRHTSSARMISMSASAIGIQDLYWEYELSRTHQFRQNIPVPSYLPTMAEEGNGFFPLIPQDIFPRGEMVTIRITPTHPLFIDMPIQGQPDYVNPHDGVFWCGFNGFYILGDSIPTGKVI